MSDANAELNDMLAAYPATAAVAAHVVAVWPEHVSYLKKSMGARNAAQMAATELAASAVQKLIADDPARFARGYRWTCDRLREEELFFHREGRYRLATFAEANAEVYSQPDYMGPYVDGLLLTQLLWFNHAGTFEMFVNRVLPAARERFDYLEVGPGHGLMVAMAAGDPRCGSVEAWDVSPTSLAETRHALDKLMVRRDVALVETDILAAPAGAPRFDLIVISEVLEHLERPADALHYLRSALRPGGLLFVNVPINSPSPDHIYLLETPEAAVALVQDAGFAVKAQEMFATQGRAIDKAVANRISVSVGMIATLRP